MPESSNNNEYDVIIVGGGLAGLVSANLLARQGRKVLLVEKKMFPFHKVCGEYVSNEVLVFLQSIGFDPFLFGASTISKLRISTPSGKNYFSKLDLGGFGLSRFIMDEGLFNLALKNNVIVRCETKVVDIAFDKNIFTVTTSEGEKLMAKLVIGSYGKRDTLDKKLNRSFIQSHTGYLGVKYHVKTDYPLDEVGLDNFKGGYCGIVKIEEDKYNICYLYKRSRKFNFNSIRELEENILFGNPRIKELFSNSEFLFSEPEVINEISFDTKDPVVNHIFMCGDAAGLITPLCGNGMSMAIHSAKLLCELIAESKVLEQNSISKESRDALELNYRKAWNKNFNKRLIIGRGIQRLFGNSFLTEAGIRCIHAIPTLENWLIGSTHGKPIL